MMYKGFTKMATSEPCTKDSNAKGTRGYTLKLEQPGYSRDIRKFLSHRVVGR